MFDAEIPSYVRLNVLRKKLDYKLAQKRALYKKFIDRLIAVYNIHMEITHSETDIMYQNNTLLFILMETGEIQIKEYDILIGIIHVYPPVIHLYVPEERIKYSYDEIMSKLDVIYSEICQVEDTYIKTLEDYISKDVQ